MTCYVLVLLFERLLQRILGEDVPLMEIENDTNIFSKIKKMLGMAK